MNTFMKSNLSDIKNPHLFREDWGSRVPCIKDAHKDFITRNNKIGITLKSLRVKQLSTGSKTGRPSRNGSKIF